MRGCIGHDVKAVLHGENACREHSAVCQLQRSRDRKVLAKRCCSRYRTCRFVAGRAARGARSAHGPRGARERERHGAQTNARLKVLRQVSHANSRSNRFERGVYVPELKPSLGNQLPSHNPHHATSNHHVGGTQLQRIKYQRRLALPQRNLPQFASGLRLKIIVFVGHQICNFAHRLHQHRVSRFKERKHVMAHIRT